MKQLSSSPRLIYLAFRDELQRLRKDSGALLILIIAVLIYPIVYSVAYKNNVLRNLPIAVVDNDHTELSRKTAQYIDATPQLVVTGRASSLKEAEALFYEGKVNGIVTIPAGFEKEIYRGEKTNVGVYCDASYFLMYKETLTASLQAVGTLSAGVEIKRNMVKSLNLNQALAAQNPMPATIYYLYNPTSGYGNYVMPGMILVILQQTLLVGIGMIGGGRTEHKKVSAGIHKLDTRHKYWPVVIGRSLLYFIVSVFNSIFTLVLVYHWFDFPDNGTLWQSMALMIPFLFSVIFLGIGISYLFKRREHAIMFLIFLSPIVLFLSGLSWPVYAMPKPLYWLSHLFPTTFMVPSYLRLRTMGVTLNSVQMEYFGMVVQMIIFFVFAVLSLRFKVRRSIK